MKNVFLIVNSKSSLPRAFGEVDLARCIRQSMSRMGDSVVIIDGHQNEVSDQLLQYNAHQGLTVVALVPPDFVAGESGAPPQHFIVIDGDRLVEDYDTAHSAAISIAHAVMRHTGDVGFSEEEVLGSAVR